MKAPQRQTAHESQPVFFQNYAAHISAVARKDVERGHDEWARINQAIAADRYALARRALGVVT